jgi:Ca-activated chloride channel family protein
VFHTLPLTHSQIKNPETVTLTVTVTDKTGSSVQTLPQNAFRVTNGKDAQEIVALNTENQPISIAIILDLSGSMGEEGRMWKRTQAAVHALEHFIQISHMSNEYLIIGFNQKSYLLNDGARDHDSAALLLRKITSASFNGDSGVLDAMHLGLAKVSEAKYPKKAIILATDGLDHSSQTSFRETITSLRKLNVLVYPIFLLPQGMSKGEIYRDTGSFGEFRSMLKDYASISGGLLFDVSAAEELTSVTERIALELQHQYAIQLHASRRPDDKCYAFKVRLSPADIPGAPKSLSLRSRETLCP